MITMKLILHGRVQGVGMRYFVHKTARNYRINGFVRNRSNGTVEAVLQGPKTVLVTYIETLKTSSPGRIDSIQQTELDTSKEYQKFSIKLF